ncbi:MAG TPA: rod shape-determining protein MreC [Candidatus Avoscillospira avistercoris]|uniref:Cell shape-determining protein MreC n=1 Tax=Candidatus Avoscillospira avistercoris TaxID=2840707 RepID=A0A9D1JTA2_9FIRM|nr:rod shape-determining protein MreC [Candidatus Avoscillospira avistercoris]
MKKFFSGRVKMILAAAMSLAILFAVVGVISDGATLGQQVTGLVLSPFRAATAAVVRQVEQFYDYLFRYDALEAENELLKQRVAELEEDARDVAQYERENEYLTALLGLQEDHPDFTFRSAYVTSWESSNWKTACTISRGTEAGIEEGMCAVTAYGQVVGMVTEAGPTWATVTTILDPSMEISASIAASGYTGVVQGSYDKDGTLRMNYLSTGAVLKNNDQVVTTGSTFYPKNLLLGYISDAGHDETGVGKFAKLTPAADLGDLEQVFLIADYQS